MDFSQIHKAWSGVGAAVGFGLMVAWMMPPTDPRPMAPNWRAQIKPIAPPAPVDFAGLVPTIALPAYPVERLAYADDGNAGDGVTVYRGSSSDVLATVVDMPLARDTATDSPMPDDRSADGGFAFDESSRRFDTAISERAELPADEDPREN